MQAALRQQAVKTRRPVFAWSWKSGWAVAVTAVLAVLVVGSSAVLAANNSMPDQPLYSIKQATEQVRVALTPSKVGKAELYAGFADSRIGEIVYLSKKGDAAKLQTTTEKLQSDLNNVAVLTSAGATYGGVGMGADHQAARGSAAVPSTTMPATTAAPALAAPAPTLTPTTGSTADNQTEKNASSPPSPVTIATQPPATITVAVPPSWEGISDPRAKLAARITYQRMVDQARLQAALATATPEARLALMNAIAVSETGYEKALQSLGPQP